MAEILEQKSELDYLLQSPEDPGEVCIHLSSASTTANYIRFADEMKFTIKSGKVLDWGCGRGHMSWLLDRRGFEVVAYNLGTDSRLEKFIVPHIPFVAAPNERDIPFRNAEFEGALSCGVLEHVADEKASLSEIHRVLRPGGYFFIYQLPQVYAYTEFINRLRGLWYHPRRYTYKGTKPLLEEAGFEIVAWRRANLIPKNLTGLPPSIRSFYNRIARYLIASEKFLVRLPLVNRLCHSLEFVARKR
jgi:ubiquinone/menaquinone biosynthesis C-methylase UbiE